MKRALITGASRGIGASIALTLAQRGYTRLALVYRSQRETALQVKEACEAHDVQVELIEADLASREGVDVCLARVRELWGGVDLLVNNAGMTADALALRMRPERWDAVLDVNLTAPFFLCKGVLKGMIRQRSGRIINLSSVIAQRSRGGQSNYAASKGAIEAMTRALAVEVASRGITVNAIAPGWIDTDMTRAVSEGGRERDEERDRAQGGIESTIPAGRVGAGEDIASLVAFLASEEASYITGQVIAVDGGLSVRL